MIVKCKSVFQLACLLLMLMLCDSCVGVPLSDVVTSALRVTSAKLSAESQDNETRQIHKESDSNLRAAVCQRHHHKWDCDLKCTENDGVFLNIGHCLTYERKKGFFATKCPYFQLEGHELSDTEPGYIKLPDNISELNDYMCGPMNRKGFLCEDCIDGFSISMTSIGSKCSNCTDAWYGVPLYLVIELVPITAFYLLILVFQIHITSAPMTSFILYSQISMFALVIDPPPPLERVVPQYEKSFLLKLNLFLYGPWNLDLFRSVLPPFCVISGLNFKYAAVLGYVSVLYPLFLIFLTWVCIELHGRGFKPIVCLLILFHKCLGKLKQDCGGKRDVVDVFSAFFVLSYSRLMYQSSLFLECSKVVSLNTHGHWGGLKYIFDYDSSITCGSSKYIAIAVVAALSLFIFNILPALLIILYPFKVVRFCLSKCKLDTLYLSTFMDKFYGCYRDGLRGGRDMRSFAGVYFLLRFLPFLYYPCKLYKIPFSFGSYLVLIFLSATLLIAIARPYKESYMNVFDTLLLGHITFMSKMHTDDYFKDMGTQLFTASLIPAFALGICILYIKVYNSQCCRRCTRKGNSQIEEDIVNSVLENLDRERETQPLLTHTSDSAVSSNHSRMYESID